MVLLRTYLNQYWSASAGQKGFPRDQKRNPSRMGTAITKVNGRRKVIEDTVAASGDEFWVYSTFFWRYAGNYCAALQHMER